MMYQWQRFHIFEDLLSHHCKIDVFNPLLYSDAETANARLLECIRRNRYDLFMTPHNEVDLFIPTLEYIRQKGIPTLLICFDNLTIPFFHKKICRHFDLVWLTSIETRYLFDRWGARTIFLPYAANPAIAQPNFDEDIERVLFIGTLYGSRAAMVNELLMRNIPVTVFSKIRQNPAPAASVRDYGEFLRAGKDMLRYPIGRKLLYASVKNKLLKQSVLDADNASLERKDPIPLQSLMQTYSAYALSLSSTANRHTGVLKKPVRIVNLRSFEIPAAGGLQFCAYNSELAGYFEEDKEAVYYRSEEDMIEKARYYLDSRRDIIRLKMKKAARKRAENEHTWFCRFRQVFDTLGIDYSKG